MIIGYLRDIHIFRTKRFSKYQLSLWILYHKPNANLLLIWDGVRLIMNDGYYEVPCLHDKTDKNDGIKQR